MLADYFQKLGFWPYHVKKKGVTLIVEQGKNDIIEIRTTSFLKDYILLGEREKNTILEETRRIVEQVSKTCSRYIICIYNSRYFHLTNNDLYFINSTREMEHKPIKDRELEVELFLSTLKSILDQHASKKTIVHVVSNENDRCTS